MTNTVTAYGDLFHLAASVLGDASQAVRLARANGLRDFVLPGLTVLVVPLPDSGQTGGVPPQ